VLGSTGLGAVNQSLDLSVGSRSSSGDDDVVELVEHGASNTTIAMLSVTDDDRGDNGQVTCRMTSDGQGHFKVARLHDTVYRIISTRPLDSRPVSTPPPTGSAEYCSERVCLSVCLSMCVSVHDHVFGRTRPIFTKFGCMFSMSVARSSSGGVMICYLFPVLWMTSYLHIS